MVVGVASQGAMRRALEAASKTEFLISRRNPRPRAAKVFDSARLEMIY